MMSRQISKVCEVETVLPLGGRQCRFHSKPRNQNDGQATEDAQPRGLDGEGCSCSRVVK